MSILDTKVAGSILSINMFSPWARDFIRIASVDSAVKWVPGGDNLVKGVQCYELFGGIALKNHTFSFFIFISEELFQCCDLDDMLIDKYCKDCESWGREKLGIMK